MKEMARPSADRAKRPRREYSDVGFFVLRSPLLPLSAWLGVGSALQAARREVCQAGGGQLSQRIAEDEELVYERTQELLEHPEVREAIMVASPALHRDLYTPDDPTFRSKNKKIQRSAISYLIRMSTRPTPFGLFAGCAVGAISNETNLNEPADMAGMRRFVRLDSSHYRKLARHLRQASPSLGGPCVANASIYSVADELRYFEYCDDNRADGRYYLARTPRTPILTLVIQAAQKGLSLEELVRTLEHRDSLSGRAESYIRLLVNHEVLFTRADLSATGPELGHQLRAYIRSVSREPQGINAILDGLRDVEELRRSPLGVDPSAYEYARKKLDAVNPEYVPEKAWHVDLFKEGFAPRLNRAIVASIGDALHALDVLSRDLYRDPLSQFKEAFRRRFESQEIPLLVALDDDVGVGGSLDSGVPHDTEDLLKELSLGGGPASREWPQSYVALLARLLERGRDNGMTCELLDEDLKQVSSDRETEPLASSLAVLISLRRIAGRRHVLLSGVAGPSAARFLGRFCHGSEELLAKVRDLCSMEAASDPEAIFAEVAFLPPGRHGNLVSRPVLRDWEVPVLGPAGVSLDRQVPPQDLLLSLTGERLILRSRSLGRRVYPRHASMHNVRPSSSLPLYRFLHLLQFETAGRIPSPFNWGPFSDLTFLPRVTYGDIVLSPARWRLTLTEVSEGGKDPAERFRRVKALRSKYGLPREVAVVRGDNRLRLDLDNVACTQILWHYLGKATPVLVSEALPYDVSEKGGHAHEIVLPLMQTRHRPTAPSVESPTPSTPAASRIRRKFPPGSAWLYLKLYGGPTALDNLLVSSLHPLLAAVEADGRCDRWFFLRYRDTEPHLRLRLHCHDGLSILDRCPEIRDALDNAMKNGRLSAIELGTYVREIERYGGPSGIKVAEQVFHADSRATLEGLRALAAAPSPSARWHFALLSIHALLDDFRVETASRIGHLRNWREPLLRRLASDPRQLTQELGNKYRQDRASVEAVLGEQDSRVPAECYTAMVVRSRAMRKCRRKLVALESTQALQINKLLASYVHMSVNRVSLNFPNQQELVLYDYLIRYYTSVLARDGRPVTPPWM